LGDNFVFGSATSDSKVIVVNPLNLNGANRNFTVHSGTGGDSAELSGAITANSAVGIIKSGNGKLTLSAANSYTGTTTINAGTLAIDGSVTSSVIVKHTGTLGGNGSITGNLTVESGGTLAAGIGTSMLTAGATTLHSGSIFSWDLDTAAAQTRGTGYGGLITPEVGGNGGSGAVFGLVLQGSQTFADGFWTTSRTWNNLFTSDADGLVPVEWASVFSSFRYANGNGTLDAPSPAIGSFTITGSTLTWSAVPEASSAFAGLLLSAGLLRRKRHEAGRQWLIGQLT
jgi:autotransporter-associated beta strand protein